MDPNAMALFRDLADRSPAEREAYYTEHHVDAPLRAEVESLLRFDHRADSLHDCVVSAAARALLERRRLGVFEIQELLGAGGMGEVYRARDTRLGRDVAIKILTRAFRDDPERVARFEREARVLASLNHPHIGVVHGLEEVDGLKALVMELVPGENLADRLARGSVPLAEALDVVHQVADALEAAHAQGVIHRDLKPANIRRRPDGTVKVVDFGLAKTLTASGDDPSITATGTVGGTPAYMSPEQVRGEPLDSQADIWSFGVVTFELLSGISAFRGKSTADTLVNVLSATPDYSLLPRGTPSSLRQLIRRCLEKDRRRRLKHIGDARIELEEALSSSSAASSSSPALQAPTLVPNVWNVRRAAALLAAALVAGAIVGAVWLAPRSAPPPVVRTIISADTLVSGTDRSFAFTPDGSNLAYISSDARQMFVRPLDALDPVVILTTAAFIRGMYPSPDGRWFGYIENNFTLKKISTSGGAPVTILELDGPSRGVAWGPDDTLVFGTGAPETGLQRVASSGGAVTVLTRPNHERGEADHVQPTWLPGGRSLLFTILPARGGLDAAKVAVLDLASGDTRTVLEGAYAARYVESGHLVYAAAGGLWATRFDLSRLETQGTPVEQLRDLTINPNGPAAEFDIARGGTLAYSHGAKASQRVVPVWVDRQGRETPLPTPAGAYRHPRLAPDGKRVAVASSEAGQGEIYIWELTRPGSSAIRMTVAAGIDWFPVWTPGARRIVFGSWRAGRFSNLYRLDLETGSTERLTDSPDMQLPTSISPDGRTVIFTSFTKSLQALRLDGGSDPTTLVETPGEERNGELSPDGRWLAYEGESMSIPGQLDIYVRPFPDVNHVLWQVTRDGGTFPVWSRDGRELFYSTLDGTIVAVPSEGSATTWKAGNPKKLFNGPYLMREGSLGRQYDVAPDGRFLMLKREATSVSPHLVMVQNWLSELARRVP
jgi:serine/threonine protein kinase/Tol biopolymer transport system component